MSEPTRKRAPRKTHPVIVGYDEAFPMVDLVPYYRNPRRGDIPTIRESLRTTGQYRPLVVNRGSITQRQNEILAGNHTYAAAQAEGFLTIAATWVDVDNETAARIVLVDNRASDKAQNDADVLAGLLVDMDDLVGTGYTMDDLAAMTAGADDETLDEVFASKFELVVECENEGEREALFARLSEEGLTVRM